MEKKRRYLPLFALTLLIIAVLACGPKSLPFGPTVTPSKQPEAVAVIPIEPTVTLARQPEAIEGLKEELYFVQGMGGGFPCITMIPPENLPAVVGVDEDTDEFPDLCLFGFPPGEEIAVDLYLPNGDHFSHIFQVGDDGVYSHGEIDDGVTLVSLDLWQPVGVPTGKWTAVVSSASAYGEDTFDVGDEGPHISTIPPDLDINPLENHTCDDYSAGEVVKILGTNFPPNRDLPLGIYHCGPERICDPSGWSGSIVYSEMVTTDSQGNFSTQVLVEPSDPAGTYYVCPVSDPDWEISCWEGDDSACELRSSEWNCYVVP